MLEEEAYQTLWNLLESIPSLENPAITVRQETLDFNERVKTDARARLIDGQHRIIDASVTARCAPGLQALESAFK